MKRTLKEKYTSDRSIKLINDNGVYFITLYGYNGGLNGYIPCLSKKDGLKRFKKIN